MLSPAPRRDEPNPPRNKLPANSQRLVSSDFTLAYQSEGAFPSYEIDENIEITREICERARHQRQVFAIFAVGFELGLPVIFRENYYTRRVKVTPAAILVFLGAVKWHVQLAK